MARKTRLMVQVEEQFHQPLERLLPEMINQHGLSATAAQLEVSKATLSYWLLKLGINVRRVALAPGETLEVKRGQANPHRAGLRRGQSVIPAQAGMTLLVLPLRGRCRTQRGQRPLGCPPAPSPEDGGGLGRGLTRRRRDSVIPAQAGISPLVLPLWGRCPKGREGSARRAPSFPLPRSRGRAGVGAYARTPSSLTCGRAGGTT